ncbi:hypothetical protein N2152v2_003000 [Parachlorella kessleri]
MGGQGSPALTAGTAVLESHIALLLDRHKKGIEHTQELLRQALTELEVAREREEGLLQQRTAQLQQEHAAKMAELERGFLVQAEQLQSQLAKGVADETVRSQQDNECSPATPGKYCCICHRSSAAIQSEGAGLPHDSDSEYDSDSYWNGDEDSKGELDARPPAVKTVTPAGFSSLQRQGSLRILSQAAASGQERTNHTY